MGGGGIHDLSFITLNKHELSPHQQKNIEILIGISDKFHADADIRPTQKVSVSEKLIVLESGHQPNFLPYPGVWKKVFLLYMLREYLVGNGQEAVAVFGFADQNLSTAKLLYENKVPAVNKKGNRKFGFKIDETQKWKCFNTLPKPGREEWERELFDLKNYYLQFIPRNDTNAQFFLDHIDTLTGILETCYARSTNMADLNAFVFSRICSELFATPVHFFRYSDVQRSGLFAEEWKRILGSIPLYTSVRNTTIREKNLDLSPVADDFFPFWFHCSCGMKVALSAATAPTFSGICPSCKTSFSFVLDPGGEGLPNHMKTMGLSGIVRNIIFSEGLGTHVFVSGSGGGLRYGQVANEISRKLGWHVPVTLSWKSRDYYIGLIHRIALKDTCRFFNLTQKDLTSGELKEKIHNFRSSLREQMEIIQKDPVRKKELEYYSGLYRGSGTQISIIRKTFSTIPSILDLLVNIDGSSIAHHWRIALDHAQVEDFGDMLLMIQDVCYRQNMEGEFTEPEIPRIYHSLEAINEL